MFALPIFRIAAAPCPVGCAAPLVVCILCWFVFFVLNVRYDQGSVCLVLICVLCTQRKIQPRERVFCVDLCSLCSAQDTTKGACILCWFVFFVLSARYNQGSVYFVLICVLCTQRKIRPRERVFCVDLCSLCSAQDTTKGACILCWFVFFVLNARYDQGSVYLVLICVLCIHHTTQCVLVKSKSKSHCDWRSVSQ
jgi:hypothetical protein